MQFLKGQVLHTIVGHSPVKFVFTVLQKRSPISTMHFDFWH